MTDSEFGYDPNNSKQQLMCDHCNTSFHDGKSGGMFAPDADHGELEVDEQCPVCNEGWLYEVEDD